MGRSEGDWYIANGVQLLRNANVFQDYLAWNDLIHMPSEKYDQYEIFKLFEGEIILSPDRPFVKTGLKVPCLTCQAVPSLLVQRVGRLQSFDEIDREYFCTSLNSSYFVQSVAEHDCSVEVPPISPSQVQAVELPVPPPNHQANTALRFKKIALIVNQTRTSRRQQIGFIEQLPFIVATGI